MNVVALFLNHLMVSMYDEKKILIDISYLLLLKKVQMSRLYSMKVSNFGDI